MIHQKPLATFVSKKSRQIELIEPTLELSQELLAFINALTIEDSYLSLTGRVKTLEEEETWIKNCIQNRQRGISYTIWAIFDGKIIGNCDVTHGGTRDWHVGKIGLMVDKNFRGEGIGQFLLENILRKARTMEIKIAELDCFSDNLPAVSLYKKFDFKEFSRLPNGFFRKNKYSDALKMYKNL